MALERNLKFQTMLIRLPGPKSEIRNTKAKGAKQRQAWRALDFYPYAPIRCRVSGFGFQRLEVDGAGW